MAKRKRPASNTLIDLLKKAAVYIRVSTHWQIDKDSLPLQREDLVNYCKFVLSMDEYEVFEDAGYSAKNTDRPAFQKMMARVRHGEFSHIIVWKIDRISRNLLDFATMHEEMKRLGITFVSKNEQFDTSTAMGEAMLKIILVFAELERNVTSERVTATMLSRAAAGLWNGGRVAFGYAYDKEAKSFSIVASEAAVVKIMYDEYLKEKSLVAVAKDLNERGYRSRRGYAWSPTTVQAILRSPFYVGTYRYNYRDESAAGSVSGYFKPESEWIVVEDNHPPLIDKEKWEAVNAILESNRRGVPGSGRSYNRGNVHIFAGLLRCGNCGCLYNASQDKERIRNPSGRRPSMYNCSRKRRFNDCASKYVNDYYLASFALNYVSNMMKAQKSFGKSTSIETLEKKLLRGFDFEKIEHIEGAGLQELYDALRRERFPDVFYEIDEPEPEREVGEAELLVSEKRRSERALTRLQNLYLYGDNAIGEAEYLIEKRRIASEINALDERLKRIEEERASELSISDEDFIAKASYFILSQQLTGKREIDYDLFIRKTDPRIVKDFFETIIQNFCIKSGRIESIRFKNGIEHKFLYRGDK